MTYNYIIKWVKTKFRVGRFARRYVCNTDEISWALPSPPPPVHTSNCTTVFIIYINITYSSAALFG